MFRFLRFVAPFLALVLGFTVTVAVPGASAGTAAPTATPVVFVHGFFANKCPYGLDVASAMSGPTRELATAGWTGRLDVVSYYNCDQGGTRIGSDSTNTSIQTIAAQLAYYIYRTYTSRGQTVDIVAHSMGGLIVRAALAYTAALASGFPSALLVDRVVAFSAPFTGVGPSTIQAVPGLPGTYQATQVSTGSAFLQSLAKAGPATGVGGTDWLVFGSSGGCDIVPGGSAIAMPGALQVLYTGCWTHTQYLTDFTTTRSFPAYLNGSATTAYGSLQLMRIFLTMP